MNRPIAKTIRHHRIRQRFMQIRARASIPALLAGYDEKSVVAFVTAINGGLAILTLLVLAWYIDQPLVFPALGPSAFILFSTPFSQSSAPRSVILGHTIGISTGFASWQLIAGVTGEAISLESGGWPVLWSASMAMVGCSVLLIRFACPHPPSCASALIVAMGVAGNWITLLSMFLGVFLLTLQAGAVHRLVGLQTPIWSPRTLDPTPE